MHAIIALQRNEQHWLLNDDDAVRYGTALSNALRHFPVQTSQKALDFAMLAFCVFQFEAPRIALSAQRRRAMTPREARAPGATVYPFPSGPATSPANGSASPANGQSQPPMAEPPAPGDAGMGGEGFN